MEKMKLDCFMMFLAPEGYGSFFKLGPVLVPKATPDQSHCFHLLTKKKKTDSGKNEKKKNIKLKIK